VSDQLPKHPEYKQVRHREMKKRVAKMMDDTIDEVVASRGILLAKEETRFLDQLEEVWLCPDPSLDTHHNTACRVAAIFDSFPKRACAVATGCPQHRPMVYAASEA